MHFTYNMVASSILLYTYMASRALQKTAGQGFNDIQLR